jgi:outer membrane protein
MTKGVIVLALTFCLGYSLSASAQEKAQSLLDIYHEAQTQDPAFASARAAYQATLEKLPQARAGFLPSLSVGADTTYNDVDLAYHSATAFPAGRFRYNSHGYTASLTQPLFRPQNVSLYKESKLQIEQAEAQLALADDDLLLRVSQAYFDVLLAQDNVVLAAAQKTAISQQLDQAKRGFEVGTLTITDTHEAQARFDLVRAQEIVALNDLEIKNQAMVRIIGRRPGRLMELPAKLDLAPLQPDDMEKWVQLAESQNLQLKIQQQATDIASQEVARNRAGHLPTIDIVGNYGTAVSNSSIPAGVGNDIDYKTIALQLQMPLYQGGAQQSRVREAVANREKARQDLEQVRRQTGLLTRQAFLGVTNGLAQVKALEQALISNESLLKSSRRGLEVGVRTNLDVLNAQQQLFNAKRDLSQARYTYLLSQLRLKAAVAQLGEPDLIEINRLLTGEKQ